ncbi:MAG: type II toxin-antitoxin system HicA family toxin [Lachnospiraceae bacterium]|nr:type II toxin-antitoxin system HicA family toxin [Lachnospiraceae bacterium]
MSERLTKQMREFIPILKRNGFMLARSNGSHFIFINRKTHRHITINKNLNRMVRERLIKENNLEV